MPKFICIHGHFYQPPRENPWTEQIEQQSSAHPFHDWNQRITSECYTPNASCEVVGDHNENLATLNNYAYMSFNFGPTLLAWLEKNASTTYQKILEADRISQKHHQGRGAAMAQCYNHMIMPLANAEDRTTQVIWGVEDFKHRFGRPPEGMWLPETAVDLKTLESLADQDIRFTILAPKQAKKVRVLGDHNWQSVDEKTLNTQQPYLCKLPSGKSISIFFYDGVVSGKIAFGKIIRSAHEILEIVHKKWCKATEQPIFSVAVDGETFGHHRRFGDMALARLIYETLHGEEAEMIHYGAYLARFPAQDEVDIHENTAWSSSEGLERWRSERGGCIHHRKNWTQKWRAPLRDAMDYLRDTIRPAYEAAMRKKGLDPWQARNQYIQTMLNGSPKDPLLEMQKDLMYMYTSCGWFFDDVSGLEVQQILQYAARAMSLAHKHLGLDLEEKFLSILEKAESNLTKMKNGRFIYEEYIRPIIP